jgi:phosphinothricin acetyltransferase
MIRDVQKDDATGICEIYNHYIENSIITFEEQAVSVSEMQHRIQETSSKFPWLVYEEHDAILGYAYASTWKSRRSFQYSVESTVYVSKTAAGNGIGSLLYQELITRLQSPFHSVIAVIALPNPASVALHEKMGFEKVAHFTEVGRKFDRWIDVGYWELLFRETE